jgi:rhodanese-related sulfurtransferase
VRSLLAGAVKEAVVVVIVVGAVAVLVNLVRSDGIPFIAAEDAFRVKTNAEFISPGDAWALFEGGSVFFVDAREPGLFEAERIEGALNAAATQAGADSLAWMVPADPSVVTYASKETQRLAGVLADKLLEAGFKKVYVLLGGIEAWKEKGLPVEGRTL